MVKLVEGTIAVLSECPSHLILVIIIPVEVALGWIEQTSGERWNNMGNDASICV